MEIDRLRSGNASVPSTTPSAGLQTACHARLLDSHGPISSGPDLISRALQSRFYMGRIRSAMSIAFATSCTLIRRDICGWAALFRFYKRTRRFPSNSYALPFIFWASIHRPWRASGQRPGVLMAQLTCSRRPARWDFANSPMRHFALLGG
jgi:hypothetical protein